jgi:DNA polymerase-3 subunit chi
MPHVSFFHGATDRLQAAARWVAAHLQGTPVLIYVAEEEHAIAMDRLLWTQNPLSFTPHCRADAKIADETPVWIATQLEKGREKQIGPTAGNRVLVNLTNTLPDTFADYAEIIEIISLQDAVRNPGRERFRFYRDNGCTIESHDLAKETGHTV